MRKVLSAIVCITALASCTTKTNYVKNITESTWVLNLHLSDSIDMPIEMKISEQAKSIYILNGDEKISCGVRQLKNDSMQFLLPVFNQFFKGVFTSDTSIIGTWTNLAKAKDYTIPFTAIKKAFPKNTSNHILKGKWQAEFSPATADAFKAIGEFKTANNRTYGTFITETGDFRFLQGYITDNKLTLACLDGAHTFLFTADVKNDSTLTNGLFYSGKLYQTNWYAQKDSSANLRNPYEISKIDTTMPFTFKATTLDSLPYVFTVDSVKNNITIVQVLGSWCPNCMDESTYYQTLLNQYGSDNFQVIGVAFENGKGHKEYVENIQRFKADLNLDYPIVYAGKASKKMASEVFPMLNEVISFPTSFILNKEGKVVAVHTGFYGPGTGDYFYQYQDKTEKLLEKLLAE